MAQEVGPTPITQAQREIPEEQLLDLGIEVFTSEELTEDEAKDKGTHPAIRKAEGHFIAYHMKNTLQQTSHWGAIRVMPSEEADVDVRIRGEILESNGEVLALRVEAVDSSGETWFTKSYKHEATAASYTAMVPGEKDAFQDLYNAIANDVVAYKEKLTAEEIREIRTISKLEFAAHFAPEAFGDYVSTSKDGKTVLQRLPADDDPMMERLLRVRGRDHMYVDTLNQYYDGFYQEMWPAYESWRKNNRIERISLRKMKRDAYIRQAVGVLMLATAVALGAGDVDNSGALQSILIVGGGAVIVDGINISRQAEIHRAAVEELSDSFGSEMKPVVMDFEGEQYELTGTVEEQYARWRKLLQEIYYNETGFGPEDPAESKQPLENGSLPQPKTK
jgi:hypothetical protein